MTQELAKTLTTALVQFIDRERPEGTMDCSNVECTNLENAFNTDNYSYIAAFIRRKLLRTSEFEYALRDKIYGWVKCGKLPSEMPEEFMRDAKELVELAKNEFGMPEGTIAYQKGVEEGRRQVSDVLAKKHLDGYCMGREDTLREMKDFIESHFNCENAKKGTPIVYNTQSGTSTLKAEG